MYILVISSKRTTVKWLNEPNELVFKSRHKSKFKLS